MTEDQDAKDSDSGGKTYLSKTAKDKKVKAQRPFTKIIIRRLPPSMTEESFLEQVSPIPEHDYLYFAKPDTSLGNNVYSRAYINFVNVDDIYLFRDKFDGYVFLDDRGVEYVGIVEYAPFQRIPKKKKKRDPKCGTIESDPVYQEFLESLNKDAEVENQPKLEYSYPILDSNDKKVQSTPLLDYLSARRQDKRGRDERRRRENDKRKMRIERKGKDMTIKGSGEYSDDENNENFDTYEKKSSHSKYWIGEPRVYHKTRSKPAKLGQNVYGSDVLKNVKPDWDRNFPALYTKTYSTFTLSSAKIHKNQSPDGSQRSGGDTHFQEEEGGDVEVKRNKTRDWDKDKDETKTYKEQRKSGYNAVDKKKNDEEENDDPDSNKKDKRDKYKESPRDQKSKKYSDTRKERFKNDHTKTDKQTAISKFMSSEGKNKLNHDDIKPFTQLPQVKTHDLTKLIEDMDKKAKLEEANFTFKTHDNHEDNSNNTIKVLDKLRSNSLESEDKAKADAYFARQNSFEDRSKSTDREGSEEKEKSESIDRRTERRIRNKDRPSLVIYQPGMGKFSKQRLAKEKDQPVASTENKDT